MALACTHVEVLINIIGQTQIQMAEQTANMFMATTITIRTAAYKMDLIGGITLMHQVVEIIG